MDNNQNNQGNKNNKQGWILVIMTTLITAFIVFGMMQLTQRVSKKEITYTEFLKMVDDGKVESVVIDSYQYQITPKKEQQTNPLLGDFRVTYYTGIMEDDTLLERLEDEGVVVLMGIIP